MSKPLPRKLDFVCSVLEPTRNRAWLAVTLSGVGAASAFAASEFVRGDIWGRGALQLVSIILAALAVLFFSQASNAFDNRSKVKMEVGLDGLRLPMQNIPFRTLLGVVVEESPSNYVTVELLLNDGTSVRLSMLDAEPVARELRARHELFKRLTAPREKARADGYRGVRISEEAASIEDGLRQEDWAEENLEAVLAGALVIPAAER